MTAGSMATLACLLEASAAKPGNVHRSADFEDVTFVDFAVSGVVLGDVIDSQPNLSMGAMILEAVRRTQDLVGTNTNLGIILLIVPLAQVSFGSAETLNVANVTQWLESQDPESDRKVFEAIRLANPGGLGKSEEMDVTNSADDVNLSAAMQLAAGRDAIARQYATGFRDVFEIGVPLLIEGRALFGNLIQGIVFAHVALMAREPDSLIGRKCGLQTAEHAQFLAAKAVEKLGWDPQQKPKSVLSARQKPSLAESDADLDQFWLAVGELDFWLRSDGHRRNPGTTADLIAASLFAGISNKVIEPPFR